MAARVETGWQSEKSLAECMRHMLDNEVATDVCFEVGPPDGETVSFRAHKYMLISRSPVFEGMFSSGMAECWGGSEAKIRVEDIDASIFKEVLIYIYCESVSLCPESAVPLMYAASKYMLPKLSRECGKCLSEGLNVGNVIFMLEQSVTFNDEQLERDCLKLISMNQNAVLDGTEILSASRQAMEAILDAEHVPLNEVVIFRTAINWAKHQLQSVISEENPTDLQIRETLGDLLYMIRFPVMKPNDFGEIVSGNNLLTAEEKESVYYYLVTKKNDSQLKFPTELRIGEEVWIDRTESCVAGRWQPNVCDAINFTTDQDFLLTGVGFFTGCNELSYDVVLEILQSANSLLKIFVRVPYQADSNLSKVSLAKPIFITAGMLYSIKATTAYQIAHYGQLCRAVCTNETVTVTFSKHKDSSKTTELHGQIPRLYYRCL